MRKQRLYLDLKKEKALTKPKREGRVLWVEGTAPANVMRWKLVQMKKETGPEGWITAHQGEVGLIPGLGRSPGEGNGYPLQYSCLENSIDRGDWWATVYWIPRVRHVLLGLLAKIKCSTKSQTRLSDFHFQMTLITVMHNF